jgi:hypothetical protein
MVFQYGERTHNNGVPRSMEVGERGVEDARVRPSNTKIW